MSTYNFTIKQGETFQTEITYKDSAGSLVDLTNYEACMQIKPNFTSSAILQLSHSKDEAYPTAGDLTGSAFISVSGSQPFQTDAVSGSIGLYIGYSASAQLTAGDYVYDLEIFTAGNTIVNRLLSGKIKLSKEDFNKSVKAVQSDVKKTGIMSKPEKEVE